MTAATPGGRDLGRGSVCTLQDNGGRRVALMIGRYQKGTRGGRFARLTEEPPVKAAEKTK